MRCSCRNGKGLLKYGMRFFLALLFVLMVPVASVWATAQPSVIQIPDLRGRILDETHTLHFDTRTTLNQLMADYERQSGHSVVFASVQSLSGQPVDEYAARARSLWGIGAAKNDGVVFLYAPKERALWIDAGDALRSKLPPNVVNHIIQDLIVPEMRMGGSQTAIIDGMKATFVALDAKDPYAAVSGYIFNKTQQKQAAQSTGNTVVIVTLLAFSVVLVIVIFAMFSAFRELKAAQERRNSLSHAHLLSEDTPSRD